MAKGDGKKLTAAEVESLHRQQRPEKRRKVSDERGLYIEVPTSGHLR